MNFEGKVALVTGCGTGIDRATSLALAKRGAVVAVNYSQSANDAEETVQNILELGGEALMVRCDVSMDDDVQAIVSQPNCRQIRMCSSRLRCFQGPMDHIQSSQDSHESHDHS